MKYGTQLETERLIIRTWNKSEADRDAFHELNSDNEIMYFFPFRRNRKQCDEVLEKIINTAKADGYGWAAAILKETGEPIGFTGLNLVDFDAQFTPATEIGWRFVVRHWRKGYAIEAAKALVQHGFEDLKLEKIVSFAVPANTPSINVMKRLGMNSNPALDFDHPSIDDSYANLRRHVYYELTKVHWQQQNS